MPKTRASNRPHAISCLRAIEGLIGTRDDVARALGCSRQCVDLWVAKGKISPRYALKLHRLGQGRFTIEELMGAED